MSQFTVGLTGGIGSGKSAVSDRFADLGIIVVDADVASRVVVEPGRPALAAIAEHFGADILTSEGSLDRAALRARVFADTGERRWLEALLHPRINEYIRTELENAASPYAILAHPLLVETGQTRICNRVLVVDVPESVQLERTMARDNNSETQVRAIMSAQASRADRLAAADDVILNDQGLDHLDAEVAKLHTLYLELANKPAEQREAT
ncbi:MAG: dephospho-CoA kinase [Pseudomonadales bacterium]|nr:dephospho-CoA kinase [Pseudomonadales bacterium]